MTDEDKQAVACSALPDDIGPTLGRQAVLDAAYHANMAADKSPYEGVAIRTRGELQWVMDERGWSGALGTATPANLTGVELSHANIVHIALFKAILSDARLAETNLSGALLVMADLSGANLVKSDLSRATLGGANLSGAILHEANLSGANLVGVNLSGASLSGANLSGATLSAAHMSVTTDLSDALLSPTTELRDVAWNGARLTHVAWEKLPVVGEETMARTRRYLDGEKKPAWQFRDEYEAAVRTYRQLADALYRQGLTEYADHYTYRAQLMQRVVQRLRI